MIQINQCKIEVGSDNEAFRIGKIASILHIERSEIISYKIIKKSIDARKKPHLFFVYSFVVKTKNEELVLRKCRKNADVMKHNPPIDFMRQIPVCNSNENIVIVGAGPAGLFAAYTLALAGYKPIVLERGEKIEIRKETVKRFWEEGILDENSNVAFGEGGAGTFSDGKLNTGVKDKTGRLSFILETFVKFGAPEEILYEAKPHMGTDYLCQVITRMRQEIEELGGVFHFHTTFEEVEVTDGKVSGVTVKDNQSNGRNYIICSKCILAIGHSARDTFQVLYDMGIVMEPKAFAVGVRVEHRQEMIDESQYGMGRNEYNLPAADYKVTARTKNGRGVYSFCMCPGGFVVNASQKEGELVINGMSNHSRSEKNANSAIIVTVTPDDFKSGMPLAGISFQREMEKMAWKAGKGRIPVQVYKDFRKKQPSSSFGGVTPNTKGDTILSNVRNLLPDFVGDAIEEAMPQFAKKIKGFDHEDTLLLGVETRTSSPLRIVRGDSMESNIKNLYPCGEGAGYAGGIMSAAMDGCKVAMKIAGQKEESDDA